MGRADYYAHGDWNVICDRCGFKYKGSEVRKEWTGYIVCRKCWDPRHPQDYVRGIRDRQRAPFVRPESPDSFTDTTDLLLAPDGDTVIASDDSIVITVV